MEALRSYKVFHLLTKAYARHLGNLQKSIPNLYGALRRSRIFATNQTNKPIISAYDSGIIRRIYASVVDSNTFDDVSVLYNVQH